MAEIPPDHSPTATDSADAYTGIPAVAAPRAETSRDSAPRIAASSAPSQTAAPQSAEYSRGKTHASNPSPAAHLPDRPSALLPQMLPRAAWDQPRSPQHSAPA